MLLSKPFHKILGLQSFVNTHLSHILKEAKPSGGGWEGSI